MNTTDQNELADRSPSEKFIGYLSVITKDARSFASCVRANHIAIERAIRDGATLEAIAHGLSQAYNVRGSLAALKSALNRIRRMQEAELDRLWYDQVDLEHYGALASQAGPRGNVYPMGGQMALSGSQGGFLYGTPVPQYLPGTAMPAPVGGFQVPNGPFPNQPMSPQQNTGLPLNCYPTPRNDLY
ncbi:hypothetical protein [Burkholderia cepacia]|uniref:hypothetical protein n=1 Tax=Burkholderia cepacia TaxID=292 RepID=UPI002AB69E30|nr:hypothetical protein [Burkholderia cepacia]